MWLKRRTNPGGGRDEDVEGGVGRQEKVLDPLTSNGTKERGTWRTRDQSLPPGDKNSFEYPTKGTPSKGRGGKTAPELNE